MAAPPDTQTAASASAAPANLKARMKASYDAIAPVYNAWTARHSPARLEYLERLLPLLRPATDGVSDGVSDGAAPAPLLRVLELGCGAGQPVTARLLTALAPVHVTANDLSTAQIDAAKAALGAHGERAVGNGEGGEGGEGAGNGRDARVDWVEGDMMALAFADGSLDAVLGFYSIIHLPQGEQAALIARIGRWLRPGRGYLLANFADKPMAGVVLEHWLHDAGWMFWSGLGVEETEARLQGAGLELVVSEVARDDVDASFHWVIARRP